MKDFKKIKEFLDKFKFIRNSTPNDYVFYFAYNTIEECAEIIRGHYCSSIKNMPTPIKIKGINDILFISENKLIVDYLVKIKDNLFEMYELTIDAYNRFENQMSK